MTCFTGSGTSNGIAVYQNADFSRTAPIGANGNILNQDGQLWIGRTTPTACGSNIGVGNLTSSDSSITITNGPGTIDLKAGAKDLHTSQFIVNSSGTVGTGANFTTIAAAIAAAQGTGLPQTIFIMPGTTGIYTENLTLVPNINLTAFSGDECSPNVTINGKLTFTATGDVSVTNLRLMTNGSNAIVVSGSNVCTLFLINCTINALNATAISFTNSHANSSIRLNSCDFDISGAAQILFASSAAGRLEFFDVIGSNSIVSSAANTISSGTLKIRNTTFLNPIITSGTAAINVISSIFDCSAINTTALTIGGSGSNSIIGSELISGTASALSIGATSNVEMSDINTSNTNAITGAGTINFGTLVFSGSSRTINTTTQVPLVVSNDAVKITTPGAYPYATVPQDGVILVDTSSARTITPLASPTTGQMHRIKDNVGSASANNITITPSGKNIDGAASYVININYGSVDIVYNGTQWNVL